ncbi:MAG: PadR family transcriptional regulator, partial [Saprospiraceae bacterium]|nr:PadR family transcriptional regulator [Saprospiraceae bacterium]
MKKTSPTRLDYAIMGLLIGGPLSGYQIRQIFETSEMGNYSSSPGSIYPALKRLRG